MYLYPTDLSSILLVSEDKSQESILVFILLEICISLYIQNNTAGILGSRLGLLLVEKGLLSPLLGREHDGIGSLRKWAQGRGLVAEERRGH
jgi:hypothetical protein